MRTRRTAAHPGPSLPTVNLLSPAAFELIAVRVLRRRFMLAGIAVLAVLVALTAWQQLRVLDAEALVDAESEETRRLSASVNELKPVQTYVAGVQSQVATVQATMWSEIWFSDVFAGIEDALPPDAQLDSLTVALADQGVAVVGTVAAGESDADTVLESPCPGPDPFNLKIVVGCVSIAGTAGSRADVGDLVIDLGANGLFVEPFITTTTSADSTRVAFSGSVGLSERVFSGRYADLAAGLFAEEEDQ